jgi:phenylacetate-coenzyme A ligase PaaK-like adenylate-forming protein
LIVDKKINTLITAPALIMKLFEENNLLFKEHQPIKKLFFAGDHFAKPQIEYLKKEFGVKLIRAAAYGSNDAGVLGYQCPECKTNEYHLLSELQTLEVFDFHEKKLLEDGELGRLIFSSKHRKGQNILRYDLGDTGFVHKQKCTCGRAEPKFSLLGRSSDSFKAGGPFLNYTKFKHYLEDYFNYADLMQILLSSRGTTQLLILKLLKSITYDAQEIEETLIKNYEELEISTKQLGVEFQVALVDAEEFETIQHSGKLRHIIDKRGES